MSEPGPSQKLQPLIEEAVSLSASVRLRALRVSVVKTVNSVVSVLPSLRPSSPAHRHLPPPLTRHIIDRANKRDLGVQGAEGR